MLNDRGAASMRLPAPLALGESGPAKSNERLAIASVGREDFNQRRAASLVQQVFKDDERAAQL